jgi:hypothetical protein
MCPPLQPAHQEPAPRHFPPPAPPAGRVLSPRWRQQFPPRYDRFSPAIVDNSPLAGHRHHRTKSHISACVDARCILVPLLGHTSLHGCAVRVPSFAAQRRDHHVTPHVSRPSSWKNPPRHRHPSRPVRSWLCAFSWVSGLVAGRLLVPLRGLGEGNHLRRSVAVKPCAVTLRNELREGELPGLLPMVGEPAEFLRVQT